MFAILPIAVLLASTSVSALVVPRRAPPPGWRFDLLENYQVYHTRYLALDCEAKHNTPFFDQCCHPMLATETLEKNRAPQCRPSTAASASAVAAEPTSTISTPADNDDDDDCDEEPSSTSDDDDEDCEDDDNHEGDHSSAPPAVTSAHVTHATHATQTHQITSNKPTPKPTSTKTASPTPKPPSSPSGSSSQVFTDGFATFFFQNGVAGACGTVHKDTDFIAAIDQARYGDSGRKSSLCGKQVQITNPANGKSVKVTIADDCPTCNNADSIDLSRSAFNAIATEEEGMVKIHWNFVDN